MSISLHAAGTHPVSGLFKKGPDPAAFVEQVREWLEKREGDDLLDAEIVEGPEGPVLLAQLHPAAEPISVAAPGLGRVEISASAHLVGPGYQLHLLGLLDALAQDMTVTWSCVQDDEGNEIPRELPAIETALAKLLAEDLAPMLAAEGAIPHSLLPASDELFEHGAFVATPLGPRDRSWAERAAMGDVQAAREAWSWAEPGRGARYQRDRALALLWSGVRWDAEPDAPDETEMLAEIARRLAEAHRAEPGLVLPWREWAHVCNALGHDDDAARAARGKAASASGPLVGYRRGNVLVALLGGFIARIGGGFRVETDEQGIWSATLGDRAVHVALRRAPPQGDVPGSAAVMLARLPLEGEPMTHDAGRGVVARAALREDADEETGAPMFVLSGGTAAGPYLARTTITFVDPAHREWAIATWRSITHGGLQASDLASGSSVFGSMG